MRGKVYLVFFIYPSISGGSRKLSKRRVHFFFNFAIAVHPESDDDLLKCFAAFKELRPHLREDKFLDQVKRQFGHSYRIVAIKYNEVVVSACGFRHAEFLAWGKVVYIDDLTTLEQYRGRGFAEKLLEWVLAYAEEKGLDGVHLDTGHHRHAAHKLYLKKGFSITSHHMSVEF